LSALDLNLNPADLAREVLKSYFEDGQPPKIPDILPPEYQIQAGVFVTLKKTGQLRGCIGTFEPLRKNLAEEIAANAVSAAVRDPRFPPVSREELPEITVSVDILGPLKAIKSEKELDPKKYGVLVRSGSQSGLLLPDIDGIDTIGEQVEIARRKAGIAPGRPVELYRFNVTRHGEKQETES